MVTVGIHFEDGDQGEVFDAHVITIDFNNGTVRINETEVIGNDNAWLPGFTCNGRDIAQIVVHS